MPIYHGFYSGFHPRHEWNADKTDIISKPHHEHGESWVALFIDLVYVAMFMSVGYLMEYCGHTRSVVSYAFVVFVIMFNSRLAIDTYSNRFFVDDLFHRLVYCIYSYGVFIMTMNICYTVNLESHRRSLLELHQSFGDCPYVAEYIDGFGYGFFITRGSLLMLYASICFQNKEAYQQFGILLKGFILSTLICVISVIFAHGTQRLYYATIVVEILAMSLPKILAAFREYNITSLPLIPEIYPADTMEMQSRLGIFYMMCLGESMIQLLHRVYNIHVIDEVYQFSSLSFVLVFSFGMQYFDAVSRSKSLAHAMARSNLSHILFVWAHPVLSFYNLFMTVGLSMMYISINAAHDTDEYFRGMLSFGAFAQVVIMVFMRMLHKGLYHTISSPSRILYVGVRLGIALAHFSVRYYKGSDISAVTLHALIAVANNILDILVAIKARTVISSIDTMFNTNFSSHIANEALEKTVDNEDGFKMLDLGKISSSSPNA